MRNFFEFFYDFKNMILFCHDFFTSVTLSFRYNTDQKMGITLKEHIRFIKKQIRVCGLVV